MNVIIIEYAIFFIITIAVVSVITICSAVPYFPMQYVLCAFNLLIINMVL